MDFRSNIAALSKALNRRCRVNGHLWRAAAVDRAAGNRYL